MSPNRFVVTINSNRSGSSTRRCAVASTSISSQGTPRLSATPMQTSLKRLHDFKMLALCTIVRRFGCFRRSPSPSPRASKQAYSAIRSLPLWVMTRVECTASGKTCSMPEYMPSVFSRTIVKSMFLPPHLPLTGRILAYRSNSRLIWTRTLL